MCPDIKSVTDRRSLQFKTLQDIGADVAALDQAGAQRAAGNWTPAQNVEHIAMFIQYSLDGFPFRMPLALRLIGPMFRKTVTTKPMKPGIKAPGKIRAFEPKPDVRWGDAVQRLHTLVSRVAGGETMQMPSPLFGRMSHEDWTNLHCRHAEMHLSFIHPQQ